MIILKSMPLIKEKLYKNTICSFKWQTIAHELLHDLLKTDKLNFQWPYTFFFPTRIINIFSQIHTSYFVIYIKVMGIHKKKAVLFAYNFSQNYNQLVINKKAYLFPYLSFI